jgi:predicted secreted protein
VTATRNMTEDELRKLPIRIGIKTVAAALGVGINEAYRQAAAGVPIGVDGGATCPVRKRGGAWVAYRPELFRALGLTDATMARAPEAEAS